MENRDHSLWQENDSHPFRHAAKQHGQRGSREQEEAEILFRINRLNRNKPHAATKRIRKCPRVSHSSWHMHTPGRPRSIRRL